MSFTISGTNLLTDDFLNYDIKSSYDISVIGTVVPPGNSYTNQALSVTVTDLLAQRTFIVGAEVVVGALANALVGVVEARAETNSITSYTVTGGRTDLYEIQNTTNLATKVAVSDPAGTTHYVAVEAGDSQGTNTLIVKIGVVASTPATTIFLFQ